MRLLMSIIFAGLLFVHEATAQEDLSFQTPPSEILVLADHAMPPSVQMDSKKEYALFTYRNTYKSLEELNRDELRLGGIRIDPAANIESNITYIKNLKLRKISENDEKQVSGLPSDPKIAHISWAWDEKKIAFTNTTDTGVELWVLDVVSANATRLTGPVLNANLGKPYNWLGDSRTLLARIIPKERPALVNTKKELPKGPAISISDGSISQNRTFPDMLKSRTDEENFERLAASELHKVDLSGKAEVFKPSGMYMSERVSPDGNYVLVTTLQKPFSYIVPFQRFPHRSVVYDMAGIEIKVVNDVPLNEVMPKGFEAVRKGKRNMNWRDDKPSTLHYTEALDGGDPGAKADFRDEIFLWDAPFVSAPVSLFKTRQRFSRIIWGDDHSAVAYDSWYDTRNMKTYLVDPSVIGKEPEIIFDRDYQDIYSDPGVFETKRNQSGRRVLLKYNNALYMLGDGFTKDGQFPFIDEFDLNSLKTRRLYLCAFTDKKEDLVSLVDPAKGMALVRIESASEFPNYYFRNIKSGALTQVTNFPNPFESLRNVHKEVIKYKRKDGVDLSGTLYLPAGYDSGKNGRLPLLIWAYPEEFKSRDSAGQNSKNPNTFTYPHHYSFIYWVTKGFAVLDHASFPILGAGKREPNDTFIKQLVMNAEAAINALDRLGVADRDRVAIGGHSYGAFMAANLLTHSKLFACGVARSGSYNRTLTPFGFQGEQRNYWDASGVYNAMSPFTTSDRMKTPLLLVHGEADNNPGTFTLQTERYFQALKGLGAPVRMVLLPKERHSYEARENVLHLLWEQDRFFEKCLKAPASSKQSVAR